MSESLAEFLDRKAMERDMAALKKTVASLVLRVDELESDREADRDDAKAKRARKQRVRVAS